MNLRTFGQLNPWWGTGSVPEAWGGGVKRVYYDHLLDVLLHQPQAILLEGPRRVGKTTLMRQVIARLMSDTDPRRIVFVSLDDPHIAPEKVFDDLVECIETVLLRAPLRTADAPFHVFLDEVAFAPDWELHIKRFLDEKLPMRFVLASSSNPQFRKKTRESLAGRVHPISVFPFSFSEYLALKNAESGRVALQNDVRSAWQAYYRKGGADRLYRSLSECHREVLSGREGPYLKLYLSEGGFPDYVTAKSAIFKEEYFWSSVAEKVLFQDLPSIFPIADTALLRRVFLFAMESCGHVLNLTQVAQAMGTTRPTLASYLASIEVTGLVRQLEKYAPTVETRMRSMNKVYAVDQGLYLSILGEASSTTAAENRLGTLAEIAVFAELLRNRQRFLYYWRERQKEVDFIADLPSGLTPVEVKYRKDPGKELAGLDAFSARRKTADQIVVTRDRFALENRRLFVPLELFLG